MGLLAILFMIPDMSLKDYWAYDFGCEQTLEDMRSVFNEAGSWHWELRDSAWYGDYLSTNPMSGVRVRVHEYPQMGVAGKFAGLNREGFSALLEIKVESLAVRKEVDEVFRRLLKMVNATRVTEIEPYD
jgi:hypothetical protein